MITPESVLDAWADAWNRNDAAALAALFTKDAQFVNVVGLWWHNNEDIQLAHQYGFDHIFAGSRMEFGRHTVRMLGDDAAVVVAKWAVTGQTSPSGEQGEKRKGMFTFVLQKFGDNWLTVSAQNTDIISGASSIVVEDGASTPASYDAPTPKYRGGK